MDEVKETVTAEVTELSSDEQALLDIEDLNNEVDEQELPDIIFKIQDDLYAVSSKYVVYISVLSDVTPTSGDDPRYRGTVIFNGKSVHVFDLRNLFGIHNFEEELNALVAGRIADHVNWVNKLEESVNENRPFELTTNPHACAFGKWYDNFKTDDTYLAMYLKQIDEPHTAIHETGKRVKKLMAAGMQEEAKAEVEEMKRTHFAKTKSLLEGMVQVYKNGVREMLIMMKVNGRLKGIVVDKIAGIKKLEDLTPLPDNLPNGKSEYIECLAKDKVGDLSDIIRILNPKAL